MILVDALDLYILWGVPDALLLRGLLFLRFMAFDADGADPYDLFEVPRLRTSSPSVRLFLGGRGATSFAASVTASVRSMDEVLSLLPLLFNFVLSLLPLLVILKLSLLPLLFALVLDFGTCLLFLIQ